MQIIREEVHVEHEGSTLRRVSDRKDGVCWELRQASEEFEIWSRLPVSTGLILTQLLDRHRIEL